MKTNSGDQQTDSTSAFVGQPLGCEEFRAKVLALGKEHYRELPWRNIDDPYAVLVSEVMLQQTQVKRVLNYWPRFMAMFPSIDALAAADVSLVLELWQGLGYNRRALALKNCAEECAFRYEGRLPDNLEELKALSGVGPATAAGVLAFAYQKPSMYLETNVRTVFLYELFPEENDVPDKRIEPLVKEACIQSDPRTWYYALLDYGAHIKATVVNPNRRSKHYVKQNKFEGSRRQKRAEIVRIVLGAEQISYADLVCELIKFEQEHKRPKPDKELIDKILLDLISEGFLKCKDGFYSVG